MFRVMQEALQNVAAHARASATWVRLTFAAQHVFLEVGDDGQGFDPQQSALPADGIWASRACVSALNLGGALSIDSRPQHACGRTLPSA